MRFVAVCLMACGVLGCEADAPRRAAALGTRASCAGAVALRYADSGMIGTRTIVFDAGTGDVSSTHTVFAEGDARVTLDAGTALRVQRALERMDWDGLAGAARIEDVIVDDSHWQLEVCLADGVRRFAGPASSCRLPSCNDLSTIVAMIEATANFTRLEETFR